MVGQVIKSHKTYIYSVLIIRYYLSRVKNKLNLINACYSYYRSKTFYT